MISEAYAILAKVVIHSWESKITRLCRVDKTFQIKFKIPHIDISPSDQIETTFIIIPERYISWYSDGTFDPEEMLYLFNDIKNNTYIRQLQTNHTVHIRYNNIKTLTKITINLFNSKYMQLCEVSRHISNEPHAKYRITCYVFYKNESKKMKSENYTFRFIEKVEHSIKYRYCTTQKIDAVVHMLYSVYLFPQEIVHMIVNYIDQYEY